MKHSERNAEIYPRSIVWRTPSPPPELSKDLVHLWLASLDQPDAYVYELAMILSRDERLRARRYRFDLDRGRLIAGRGILRIILSRYLGIPPGKVLFSPGEYGKVHLGKGSATSGLQFNLSHSHGFALYAFALDRRIGVDIERIVDFPELKGVAVRFFSACDYKMPSGLEAFFNCWTRKEAFSKAVGRGLTLPSDLYHLSPAPGEPAMFLSAGGYTGEVSRWSVQDLSPAPGYAAAIVVEGRPCALQCWKWQPEI